MTETELKQQNSNAKLMTGAELSALYPGAVFEGNVPNFSSYVSTNRPDGSAEIVFANGRTDAGRWQVQGDRLCLQWGWINQGRQTCRPVYRLGEREFASVNDDGTMNPKFTKRP
ncbi:hypothetical protein STVA_22680 [Allostella vacuolata]|nr:hypothetical protein STVA_22680 [Stella vacuolata]